MKRTLVLSALAASLAIGGCSAFQNKTYQEPTYEQAAKDSFLTTNRTAIDKLFSPLDLASVGDSPILVATIVNVNDLRRTAPLGRTLSEQYASQIVVRGFNVKELKLRGDVFVQEGTGELMLSREVQNIARSHSASLVLVGTYSAAADMTYINLKLVRTEDGRIVRAYDYALPNDKNVKRLLQASR